MGIKKLRPTSSARRFQTYLTFDEITTDTPYEPLLEPKKRISGRNSDGHITVRRRGGGAKRLYRIIDFKRDKTGIPAKVATVEYDPNRSALIALLHYLDGEKRYIVAPVGLKVGQTVVSGPDADIIAGNALPLKAIPLGTTIHNIELRPGKGGRTRWLGRRPKVRGVAMNPVDHPHGGGEGKTSGGRNPVTPWGQPTRGYKTRRNKRTKKMIVRDRRVK